MSDVNELEGRIAAALERIGLAIDALPAGDATAALADLPAESSQMALQEALQAERDETADMAARLRAAEREIAEAQGLRETVARLTAQLDAQGLDVQRMRQNVVQLRETVRALREAQASGVEAHLLNSALLAELDALRVTRASEIAEMDEILAELKPLIAEVQDA